MDASVTTPISKSLNELLADFRGPDWLIPGLLPAGAQVAVGGLPGAGKSFVALEMAAAVASGRSAFGRFPVPEARRVLVLDEDTATADLLKRLKGLVPSAGQGNLRLISKSGFHLDKADGVRQLRVELEAFRPALLVVDAVASIVSGGFQENAADSARALTQNLSTLQKDSGLTVLLVAHARKGAVGKNPLESAFRGSSAISAVLDLAFAVYQSGQGEFILRPIPKRFPLGTQGFVARVGEGPRVEWVAPCLSDDPAFDERVRKVVRMTEETQVQGATVKMISSTSEGYLSAPDARECLDFAVSRGLLVKDVEGHNRFRFWAPKWGVSQKEESEKTKKLKNLEELSHLEKLRSAEIQFSQFSGNTTPPVPREAAP